MSTGVTVTGGAERFVSTIGESRANNQVTTSPATPWETVGELQAGDRYDDSVVVSVTLLPYAGATWDLLPSGPTGTYFANGVLLGSTLTRKTLHG